ncbi:MAG: hypothetical protein QOE31_1335 [Solirubrobacteraceae bacterium]|nr:hypothetical protein [Solirubrobacteraceae bacterium]
MSSSVRASSATSSSASTSGIRWAGSRVRSILRAVAVSAAIGAIARRATISPASSARPAPLSTPMMRNSRRPATVDSSGASGRAYWT